MTISHLQSEGVQVPPLQQKVMDPFPKIAFIALEILRDVVGVGLVDLRQQLGGDHPLAIVLDGR